jgi:hypothetical membrane protein
MTSSETSVRSASALATISIASSVYAAFALVSLHVLRPDYAPASNFISNYAVGPYGWVMTTWFVAMSGGLLTLTLGLAFSGLRSIAALLGMVLLIVASLGLVVSAVYPTDIVAPSTRSGEIHDISFLVNVSCIIIGTVLLSVSFGSHSQWRSYRRTALLLAALIVSAFIVQLLTLHKGMPYGLANRLFVVVTLAWLIATAVRLRRAVQAAGFKSLTA